jgi:plasmid stability protein
MAQLIVRDLDDGIVAALKARAAEHGRSAEAEHRRILEAALGRGREVSAFAEAAAALRARFRSEIDSTEVIRAARDGRHSG